MLSPKYINENTAIKEVGFLQQGDIQKPSNDDRQLEEAKEADTKKIHPPTVTPLESEFKITWQTVPNAVKYLLRMTVPTSEITDVLEIAKLEIQPNDAYHG